MYNFIADLMGEAEQKMCVGALGFDSIEEKGRYR